MTKYSLLVRTPTPCRVAGRIISTPCLKKTVQTYFLLELCQISTDCENFWHKDSKEVKLLYSFSTSPNLYQRTTVLYADVPNWYGSAIDIN